MVAGPILLGAVAGCVVGLAAGYGIWRWARRPAEPPAHRGVGELPLAADLLAACLAAGAGPREAAREVGRSLDGAVADELAHGAAELALGGDPRDAWRGLAALPGADGLAVCLEQSAYTGVPVVEAVSRLAEECRAERARTAAARARRASVLVTGPLGLCFLPAFLAVGVAPVVLGLATGLMGG
ncbi:type II secretion system F family protein [Streptomyces sp. NPDC051940]|uniref:type II secretion system F family protein n=1 Tax=Streptomyces sp. NPDC051940 TaxID=3155675 RepID=UPI00343C8408